MNIELRDIHKRFGAVHANAGITLRVPAGSIFGILGENGAGKSTLMKILSGFIHADSGQILLDGRQASLSSPADAMRRGIGMLHQDPLDFPPMRVLDNFIAGSPGTLFPSARSAKADFAALQARLGFTLDPEAYVDSLSVGERQQLEILRLLWLGARALILDEPTTGISAPQKEKLFAALRLLAGEGRTVLVVSHKLRDVEALCSEVAVLREGALVGTARAPYNRKHLVELMFGKAIATSSREPPPRSGDTLLDVAGLVLEGPRFRVGEVSLAVRAGEVIGIAGMEGSGQDLFLRACAGLLRPVRGRVRFRDVDLTGRSYHEFLRHGIAHVPAARLEEGLACGLTVAEHYLITEESPGFFLDTERAEAVARERITSFSIRGHAASTVESLSGGNQQRMLLSLLKPSLSVILVEHPTRNLDYESSLHVWERLDAYARHGSAILFISSDLDEILQYSHQILVFFGGRVWGPVEASATSVAELGHLIGGTRST